MPSKKKTRAVRMYYAKAAAQLERVNKASGFPAPKEDVEKLIDKAFFPWKS